jgi:hypothetical protein
VIRDEIETLFVAKFGLTCFEYFSCETLHGICVKHSKDGTGKILNYLNFLTEKNDLEFLKNFVSGKNSKKQTILFYFYRDSASLILMLEWFRTTFENDENFLENFLLEIDENLDSFFKFILKKCEFGWKIRVFFAETYNFLIRNFDKVFVKELLLLENNENENFLNIVCERRHDRWCGDVINILNILFEDFQNDQDFFAKLINEKAKKNRHVNFFMKHKLKIDLSQASRFSFCKIC